MIETFMIIKMFAMLLFIDEPPGYVYSASFDTVQECRIHQQGDSVCAGTELYEVEK